MLDGLHVGTITPSTIYSTPVQQTSQLFHRTSLI
jgi:hypothetical protein